MPCLVLPGAQTLTRQSWWPASWLSVKRTREAGSREAGSAEHETRKSRDISLTPIRSSRDEFVPRALRPCKTAIAV